MAKLLKIALFVSMIGIIGALTFGIHYQQMANLPFLKGITTEQAFILMLVCLEVTILGLGVAAVSYVWQKFFPQKSD